MYTCNQPCYDALDRRLAAPLRPSCQAVSRGVNDPQQVVLAPVPFLLAASLHLHLLITPRVRSRYAC
jgi:hypothetical protein